MPLAPKSKGSIDFDALTAVVLFFFFAFHRRNARSGFDIGEANRVEFCSIRN